ncbi:MAG: hypothetical protein JWO70_5113 [Betaproteobacteria bacterium]|nr:hypothetical protein [Betaproteobacteria bacterium]
MRRGSGFLMNGTASACMLISGLALLVPGVSAQTPTYPVKPIRLIIGFTPGGASDLVARVYAPRLSAALGQQVLVENRPGANGIIARNIVAKAPPDGHTLTLISPSTLVLNSVVEATPFDVARDFAPVARIVDLQNILITHPSLPARDLREFIRLAKAQPGKLNYATSGVGGAGHLAAQLLSTMAGIDLVHVPYRGGSIAINDLLAGHVDSFMAIISTAVPHVQSGKARAIAVSGARRSSALPDVPTMAQSGLTGYDATTWYGFVVPAGTPNPIIQRLYKEIIAITNDQAIRQHLESRGIEAFPAAPEVFAAYIKAETPKWTRLVQAAGVKAE